MAVRLILIAIYLLTIILGYSYGSNVPGEVQLKLTELLVTFSSIVFGVLGVWLASVFPNVMSGIYKKKSVQEKKDLLKTARRLLIPLGLASLVALTNMFIRIVAEPLQQLERFTAGTTANGLLFAFIGASFVTLCIALVQALAPGIQLLFDGMDRIKHDERKSRYFSRAKRKDS